MSSFSNPKCSATHAVFFFESFNQRAFDEATGSRHAFVQDNHSRSACGVLRGLHYQIRQPQGEAGAGRARHRLRRRRGPAQEFAHLRAMGRRGTERGEPAPDVVPPGFAHGFVVLSESADFLYKTTDYYAPEHERCIAWNDPELGIDWRFAGEPSLSAKDAKGAALREAEVFP